MTVTKYTLTHKHPSGGRTPRRQRTQCNGPPWASLPSKPHSPPRLQGKAARSGDLPRLRARARVDTPSPPGSHTLTNSPAWNHSLWLGRRTAALPCPALTPVTWVLSGCGHPLLSLVRCRGPHRRLAGARRGRGGRRRGQGSERSRCSAADSPAWPRPRGVGSGWRPGVRPP